MVYILLLGLLGPVANEARIEKVESEARRYRIHIYETYRDDREEYDKRIAAGEAILEQWRAANHPAANADEIEVWFAEARTVEDLADYPAAPTIEIPLVENDTLLFPSSDAPEGFTAEGPSLDPTTPSQEFVISRVSPSALDAHWASAQDALSWTPEAPRPWRSLGNAVWVGVEESWDE